MSSKQSNRNQHIKVFARVRPRNTQELRSQVVVECMSNKEIAVKDKGQTKNFTFDRVFGPESKQVEVYKAVVAPMINEVLQGYNCTVFAYGQTGTGKTFTMVGDRTQDMNNGWENDPLCGIVPRTLAHLFDELKVRAEEYTVRVSFLELYNEELCDLLAPADNDDTKTLRLFEDSMKKGSVIVSGLEERTVYEKNDVYPILEAGSLRRQTAPTLMNASSSRSHTIFTVTVHVKVTTPEGEDLFKTGKLNLVDLAGSENIGRSGAVDMRAREAGNINQSLLTLGRVITSLVERTPHVPYRESKLTRILQDSLGGRTKTSIIATVSPALCNLEETLSTFDYAHRARYITNKPEINQKTSKHVLLKNYTDEIERLRRDLMATREKHGVYLQNEDYNSMLTQIDSLNKDLINKIQLLKVREEELAKQEDIMASLNMNLYETKSTLHRNIEMLHVKERALQERERALQELNNQAQVLLRTADEATEDSKRLHDRLDRARIVHAQNEQLVEQFKSRFVGNLAMMKTATQTFLARGTELVKGLLTQHSDLTHECRVHEGDVATTIYDFLNKVDELMPELSEKVITQLTKTTPILTESANDLETMHEKLSHSLPSAIQAHLAALSQDWLNLTGRATSHLNRQAHLASAFSTAHEAVNQSISEFSKLPNDLAASCRDDQEALIALEAQRKSLLDKLQALQEQERQITTTLRCVDDEIATKWRNVERARHAEAAEAVAAATRRNEDLLHLLTDMANINAELISSAETVPQTIDRVRDGCENIETICQTQLESTTRICSVLTKAHLEQASTLSGVVAQGRHAQQEVMRLLTEIRQRYGTLTKQEGERLQAVEEAATSAHNQLAGEISEFCEQAFANIHDRCTELKVNLKEEFLRDEKTGNTPQRKEFQYPKRLVTAGKFGEGQENVPPVASVLSNSQEESASE